MQKRSGPREAPRALADAQVVGLEHCEAACLEKLRRIQRPNFSGKGCPSVVGQLCFAPCALPLSGQLNTNGLQSVCEYKTSD